jgi:hypothetical protein
MRAPRQSAVFLTINMSMLARNKAQEQVWVIRKSHDGRAGGFQGEVPPHAPLLTYSAVHQQATVLSWQMAIPAPRSRNRSTEGYINAMTLIPQNRDVRILRVVSPCARTAVALHNSKYHVFCIYRRECGGKTLNIGYVQFSKHLEPFLHLSMCLLTSASLQAFLPT